MGSNPKIVPSILLCMDRVPDSSQQKPCELTDMETTSVMHPLGNSSQGEKDYEFNGSPNQPASHGRFAGTTQGTIIENLKNLD